MTMWCQLLAYCAQLFQQYQFGCRCHRRRCRCRLVRYAHFNIEIKLSPMRLMPKILLLVLYLRFYDAFFIRTMPRGSIQKWIQNIFAMELFALACMILFVTHWFGWKFDVKNKTNGRLNHSFPFRCFIQRNQERDMWPTWKATLSTRTYIRI